MKHILPISISEAAIANFCQQHHIRRLSLFGSVLRDDFNSESDVDILVEYQPDSRTTYFDMTRQQDELGQLWGRVVDLRTPMELSRHFRKQVLQNLQVIYEQTG